MDCGLISKKPRGLNEKCRKLEFSRNCFPKGNPWTESTSLWTTSGAGPWWTTITISEKAHRRTAEIAPPCDGGEQSTEEALGGVDVVDSEASN
jgi:hypothetical protein